MVPEFRAVERPQVTQHEAEQEDAPTTRRIGQRAQRLRKLAEASTISFSIDPDVRQAIETEALAAGQDLAQFMRNMVEDYVLLHAPEGAPEALKLTARREVLDQVVQTTRALDAEGRFDPHFILTVVSKLCEVDGFTTRYEEATGAERLNEKAAQRARHALNRQIGRIIRTEAGAKAMRNDAGKIMRADAKDTIISSYPLLTRAG